MNALRVAILGVAVVLSASAWAAIPGINVGPLIEWDVQNSTDETTIPNTGSLQEYGSQTIGHTLGYNKTPEECGDPVYNATGAKPVGAEGEGRAWFDFEQFGCIVATGSSPEPRLLGNQGYTFVGYFSISDYAWIDTTGIGGKATEMGTNTFLGVLNNGSFFSRTTVRDFTDGQWEMTRYTRQDDLSDVGIPTDGTWFQFAKVFDPANKEIRYYVDGQCVLTADWVWEWEYQGSNGVANDIPDVWHIQNNVDELGAVGYDNEWRLLKGVGYSYYAAYDYAMDDDQVLASYAFLSGTDVPEPATMTLLTLGGLAVLRRKR